MVLGQVCLCRYLAFRWSWWIFGEFFVDGIDTFVPAYLPKAFEDLEDLEAMHFV